MAEGRQIPHHGEALVLRTWPFHEADLLVSLFTRQQGKVKGVARHAMKSRRRFGGALEPTTYVRAHYTERPKQELVRLDQFEILWSPMTAPVSALRLAGLELVAEVLEEALPDNAVEDNVFRLAVTVLTAMDGAGASQRIGESASQRGSESASQQGSKPAAVPVWVSATYFCLWMNRLMGWWPEVGHCAACGLDLRGGDVWWSPTADGVTCADDRRPGSKRLSAEGVRESVRMGRVGLAELLQEEWPQERGADLRAFVVGVLERHLERRLRSAVGLV